jgi:hypothetical protein
MYARVRLSDTFLARNSPNVTAGLMCPPAAGADAKITTLKIRIYLSIRLLM